MGILLIRISAKAERLRTLSVRSEPVNLAGANGVGCQEMCIARGERLRIGERTDSRCHNAEHETAGGNVATDHVHGRFGIIAWKGHAAPVTGQVATPEEEELAGRAGRADERRGGFSSRLLSAIRSFILRVGDIAGKGLIRSW